MESALIHETSRFQTIFVAPEFFACKTRKSVIECGHINRDIGYIDFMRISHFPYLIIRIDSFFNLRCRGGHVSD